MKVIELLKKGGRLFKLLMDWEKEQKVSEEAAQQRMDICKKCPMMTNKFGFAQCKVCGCNLELKTKLVYDSVAYKREELETVKCPEGRW